MDAIIKFFSALGLGTLGALLIIFAFAIGPFVFFWSVNVLMLLLFSNAW